MKSFADAWQGVGDGGAADRSRDRLEIQERYTMLYDLKMEECDEGTRPDTAVPTILIFLLLCRRLLWRILCRDQKFRQRNYKDLIELQQ